MAHGALHNFRGLGTLAAITLIHALHAPCKAPVLDAVAELEQGESLPAAFLYLCCSFPAAPRMTGLQEVQYKLARPVSAQVLPQQTRGLKKFRHNANTASPAQPRQKPESPVWPFLSQGRHLLAVLQQLRLVPGPLHS